MKKCSKFWAVVLAVMWALCASAWGDVAINETNFPDDGFRDFVADFDSNGDEILSTAEIAR